MNEHSFKVLEYHELLALIAGYTQSQLGADIVQNIRPHTQLNAIQSRRNLYGDLLGMAETSLSLPPLRIDDISQILREVAPDGAVVAGVDLNAVRGVLDVCYDLQAFLTKPECLHFSYLQKLAAPLNPCNQLRFDIARSIDSDGAVLDSASPKLRELRRACITTEAKIQRYLDTLVKSNEIGDNAQERFVTMRNGRFVIPIRKDAHTTLTGIVHDLSNSGQTMFVEPNATLGWGNDLARLRIEERDEVRRILAVLSGQVRLAADSIRVNQRIVAELDAAAAVARWAVAYGCHFPNFGGYLSLHQARHPLLMAQFRKMGGGRDVVPLDLELPKGTKILAITGSNTGGKTIALKTTGLLALAAQSGLPIPASQDSQFAIYDHILADIGDEQSIEANLSTYSGHISNIASILEETWDGSSLVLLDELGSGTDPLEGGAIACAILAAFLKRKAVTITTTHLGMVKNYVQQHPQMTNAAVRFDINSLKPLFILDIGRPGASYALLTAKRIGLPADILADAENHLSGEHLRMEEMLAKMEADQKTLAEQARQIEETNRELIQKRDQLRSELDSLRNDRKKLTNEAYQKAQAIVDNTRRDMENLVREIREKAKRKSNDDNDVQTDDIAKIREKIVDRERRIGEGLRTSSNRPAAPVTADELQVGKKVWIERLNAHGKIVSVSENKKTIIVSVDGVNFTMKAADLQKPTEKDEPPKPTVVKIVAPIVKGDTSHEINLIGLRVEDALEQLEPFINRSIMARIDEIRVVHGFGTGRLRAGIHEWLRRQPSVRSFHLGREPHDIGGAGCTIVKLRL